MMATFVGEDKSAIVFFDILSSELIKSTHSDECEVIIVSPWVKDYPIPPTWPSFSSNFSSIKNMQRISDILRKILENDVKVTLLTKSEKTLRSENFGEWNISASLEFHRRLQKYNAIICYHSDNHAKHVLTSENVFIGSANATPTGIGGEQGNAGSLHSKRDDKKFYEDARAWCLDSLKKTENPDDYFSK